MRRGSPPKSNIDHDIFRLLRGDVHIATAKPDDHRDAALPKSHYPNTASPLDEPSIGRVFLARSRQQIADRHAGAEGPRYNYDVAGFRFRLHRVAAGVR
jgi:hypothetical protein